LQSRDLLTSLNLTLNLRHPKIPEQFHPNTILEPDSILFSQYLEIYACWRRLSLVSRGSSRGADHEEALTEEAGRIPCQPMIPLLAILCLLYWKLDAAFPQKCRRTNKMLCAYCRLFDFRSMAAEVIANWRDPLPSADYDNYGSNLFKYHSTLIGVHSAIAEGCGLCSLFWETWLENSQNWRWEEDIFSDEEGDMNRTADFKLAISKNLESFAPSLSFGLCHVSPNFGSKVGNMQNGDESIKIS